MNSDNITSKDNLILCYDVRYHPETPMLGAEIKQCSICTTGIWISPSSLTMKEMQSAKPVCLRCGLKKLEEFSQESSPPKLCIPDSQKKEFQEEGISEERISNWEKMIADQGSSIAILRQLVEKELLTTQEI